MASQRNLQLTEEESEISGEDFKLVDSESYELESQQNNKSI